MLVVIAHAVISTLYITGYQHVYSQTPPSALFVGPPDSLIVEMLEDEGYSVTLNSTIPSELDSYNVVVLEGNLGSPDLDGLEDYVEDGGGLVYLSGAAESLDLASNYDWLGAHSVAFSGLGENATVSIGDPLGSGLLANDPLMLQAPEQSGAIGVSNLEGGAVVLAQYTNGNAFAYSYEPGGKVYFHAYADAGIGDDIVQDNVEELLISGIIWSTSTSEPSPEADVLPLDTSIDTGNNKPSGSIDIVFSQSGPDSEVVSVPTDPTQSIFVTADAGLVNPILYFEADGQVYQYRVQIDKGTLLTFPSALNMTSARFEVDNWLSGMGRVGYVTLRNPPACSVPAGAAVTNPGSIPADAVAVGSTDFLDSINIASPPVPVTSIVVGFDNEQSGYLLSFGTTEGQFTCPIQSEVIEVSFDEPTLVSDVAVENDGPWGVIGYIENLGDATIYARFTLPKETVLPAGFNVETGTAAPSQVHSAGFSLDQPEVSALTGPTKKISALWISADGDMVEPYVYFTDGENWYSIAIEQTTGSLFHFPSSIEVEEIYASANSGQSGSITVGYVYPILAKARAGSDQSVQEEQAVYLDGRASTGQGAIAFKWTQIEGPSVELQNANTATPSFGAPEVDELGARLSFRLLVTDFEGAESSDIVVINIKNEKVPNNIPPVIGAIPVASVDEGAHVVLAASAFDPDGDTLKYTWAQTSGPTANLSGDKTATLSFGAPEISEDSVLTFQIKVADGHGHSTTKDVLVTIINLPEEIVMTEPVISGGDDQVVLEGSTVFLTGGYQGDAIEDFRWEQTGGVTVTLEKVSLMEASFVAPETDVDSSTLTFRFGSYTEGIISQWDEVSVTVNNTAQVQIKDEGGQVDPTFEISEPTFSAVESIDAEPPKEIHRLGILGAGGAISPNPTAPVRGIWINATSEMSGLELHFSSLGRKYSLNAESDRATAYVFDRQIDIQNVNLTASSNIPQFGIGYYYDQIPLIPVPTSAPQTTPAPEASPPIQVTPPAEGAIIKFARENQIIAGLMAIAVPVGIGVSLKMASTHRRKAKTADPARTLFPRNDPVAGEAEKVRPVIEELEKMLGRNLDTALNASELLDKFGSGRSEAAQR